MESRWSHFEEDVDYVVPLSVRKLEVDQGPVAGDASWWLPGYSEVELRNKQVIDGDLGVVIYWLESGVTPGQFDLALQSPEVRHYWLMKDQLVFKDGVLFYRWEDFLESRFLS